MKGGWTYKKLGEVCEILNGFAFKSNQYVPKGIRVIRITNVQKGYVEDKDPKFYPNETLDELRKYVLNENDLLISLTGNVGRVGIIDKSLLPAYLNQRVGCIRVKNKKELMISYLYFLLNSDCFENDCIVSSRGAAQKNMSTVWLSEYKIPIPSLDDQRRIVSRLDSAFSHIDELKANAEKQLSEAKALFQKALAEEMKPKEGWEEKTLGEITVSMADGPFGSNLKKEHYTTNKEVRIIQLSNIGEEGWREDNTKYTTFEHLKTIQRSEVKPGDVVIAKMMPAGRAILCPDNEPKYVLSSDAVRATLKEGLDKRFVCFAINSSSFRRQVYANVSGSGRVRTSLTKLRDCKLYIPSPSDQQAIVTRLDALSSQVRNLEENCRKTLAECDALKQAMLREVFE